MVPHRDVGAADLPPVLDHVVVELELLALGRVVIGLANDIARLPSDILPAEHGVSLHPIQPLLLNDVLVTNGSPPRLLAVVVACPPVFRLLIPVVPVVEAVFPKRLAHSGARLHPGFPD